MGSLEQTTPLSPTALELGKERQVIVSLLMRSADHDCFMGSVGEKEGTINQRL